MEQASSGSILVMVNFISYLEIDINNNELRQQQVIILDFTMAFDEELGSPAAHRREHGSYVGRLGS